MYLRYPNEGRTLDTINNLRISTQNGLVPISNFVKIKASNTTGNIVRVNSKNAINSLITSFFDYVTLCRCLNIA